MPLVGDRLRTKREEIVLEHIDAENRRDYEAALQDFSQAVQLWPASADVWNERCWMRAIARQLQGALADCNEALRLDPDHLEARDSRAFTYMLLGQIDNAIADYDAVLGRDPQKPFSLYGRGLAKRRKGDVAGGEADMRAAKALKPDIAEKFEEMGVR